MFPPRPGLVDNPRVPLTPTDLHLRHLEAEDVPTLAAWLLDAGLQVPPGAADGSWAEKMLADPRVVCVTAYRKGGPPEGFFRLDVGPDRVAELTLIVAPRRRRRGIGSYLLQAALQVARNQGLRRILALVDDDNQPALEFFLEHGFEETGQYLAGYVHLSRYVHGADSQPPLEITQ